MIIESVKFSDENRVRELGFTQGPIAYANNAQINFDLIPSNSTDSEKFGNLTIDINVFFINKNVRDNLRVNFPYNIKPSNTRFNLCKSKYNSQQLKKSIDWFKNWLSNPITKQKFAKNFKYDNQKVEKHFETYFKILDQITLEHIFSTKENGAWVNYPLLQQLGFQKPGFDIPITINCSVSVTDNDKEIQETLIHEIQHILSYYHKLHPFRDDIFAISAEKFDEMLSSEMQVPKEEIKNLLKKEGFDDKKASEIATSYDWYYKNDYEHLVNANENLSVLFEVRQRLGLKPEQPITKELLIQNYFKNSVKFFIMLWIFSKKSMTDFLNYQNSIAKNKQVTGKEIQSV